MNASFAALLLLAALWAAPARAAFEDQGAGARAPGMGDAFTALADDAYAAYYNPAGLAQLDRPQLGTAYSRLFWGLSDGTDLSLMDLAYAYPLRNGRQGTLAAGIQRFSAKSFYSEQTLRLSYGRQLWLGESGNRLLGGLSAKRLSHSFGTPPEAANPCDDGLCTGSDPDPVLSGKTSKSSYDADFGLLYQFKRRWRLGLAVQHIMQPDVGFVGPDKLPMSIRMGAAWRSLWMSLIGEIRQEKSAAGDTIRDYTMAAERYFPTLSAGQFGIRGALTAGAQDYKRIATGLSYRINKMQIDYSFQIPLGSVQGTAGTHRVALLWHFGAPAPEEEITQQLLDQARQLREGAGPSYGYEYAAELRPQNLEDPAMAEVRRLIEARSYRLAHEALTRLIFGQMPTPSLVRLSNRLQLVAQYYPDLSGPRERWETSVVSALYDFLRGSDRKAVLKASYAFSLNRNDDKFAHFLSDMEKAVGIKAERLPAEHPRGFVDEMLVRAEAANSRHETTTVDLILRDLLDLEDNNSMTMEKVGSMHFILGRYQDAVDIWTKALASEKTPAEVESLQYHINLARQRLGTEPAAAAPAPAEAAPKPAETAPAAPAMAAPPAAARPAAAPAPQPVRQVRKAGSADDIPRLYQKGVEHYARGEYLQATAMFMRILQIDPENGPARKALERLQKRVPAQTRP
ncbi:MAG: type IX secretion system membrane protein PorP/SprF [Elusimicrobia bacterium]|nr:type IX secretion system membrane protein PorP/SprF [Elusimicrobiota bacterium]